jgi:hypothetical protein
LARQFPEVAEVRRARRELSLYQRPEYSVSLMRTSAPATSVTQGNGLLSEISAFSSPIGYRWRVHAGANDGHERYAEGDITLRRAMLGIEYRVPGFVLQLDSTGSSYGVVRAGAELQATWNPNDTWQIYGKGARFSPGTPLRALLHGVTADYGGTPEQIVSLQHERRLFMRHDPDGRLTRVHYGQAPDPRHSALPSHRRVRRSSGRVRVVSGTSARFDSMSTQELRRYTRKAQ